MVDNAVLSPNLWWLLVTSVHESDGCALDDFRFLGAVAYTDQRTQEHFLCLPGSCRADAVHLLIWRKLTGSAPALELCLRAPAHP
jgi:hypothetical protein